MRIKINRSYQDKKISLKNLSGDALHMIALEMVKDAPHLSKPFVDTGAFITSWQIVDSRRRGRPRGKSSHGRPRRKGDGFFANAKAQESQEQLIKDVRKIDFDSAPSIVLRNGAPHARYVDAKHSKVMQQLRNKYGRYS